MAHDVWEARSLTRIARETGVTTQMGNERHSGAGIRRAVEMIWGGGLAGGSRAFVADSEAFGGAALGTVATFTSGFWLQDLEIAADAGADNFAALMSRASDGKRFVIVKDSATGASVFNVIV